LPLSNPEKVFYPVTGFTKRDIVQFYERIAPFILPHLKDRPVTLKRYPDGIRGESFWEKDAPAFTPAWVETVVVPRKRGPGDIHYVVINDARTLIWCAGVATIEFHPFLHRISDIATPTAVVFDLDPGEGADVLKCAEVAFLLKEVFEKLRLKVFPKVSGSKGLQLWAPLNTPVSYASTNAFGKTVAELLHDQQPDKIVAEMDRPMRRQRVFIDWSQNMSYKTTVGVYSLRAKREHPYVSLPVKWSELRRALDRGNPRALYWQADDALKRVEQLGDLFEPVLRLKQRLPDAFVRAFPTHQRQTTITPRLETKKRASSGAQATSSPRRSRQGGKRRFMIQVDEPAQHLLRLELEDTLVTWAIAKGIPQRPNVRRSAHEVDDVPLRKRAFENALIDGAGAGAAETQRDIGLYEVLDGGYAKGRLHFFLDGERYKGEWLLEQQENTEHNSRVWVITKLRSM
jgi:bifunctional non-homologous end joining protein LigD